MIELRNVNLRYADDTPLVLRNVNLIAGEGELVLVAGPTGAGKSSLLGLLNGLVPHFSGGILSGSVTVAGLSTGVVAWGVDGHGLHSFS